METYEVYKDGKLLGKGLTRIEVARLIQISTSTLDLEREDKSEQDYPLHIKGYEVHIKVGSKTRPSTISPLHWEQWNNIYKAASLIREGKGKIVTVKKGNAYRKVTVPR